jgi:hypothetical protein
MADRGTRTAAVFTLWEAPYPHDTVSKFRGFAVQSQTWMRGLYQMPR